MLQNDSQNKIRAMSLAAYQATGSHFDVIILGAGISGIGAAYQLQVDCPNKSYTVLEGRDAIGGTWDLFRYPGVRSDSDMFTLGYSFRPWHSPEAIAPGDKIRDYVTGTAREFGIDKHIRFGQRVIRASWSTDDARWIIEAEVGPDRTPVLYTCNFFYVCSGYYDYQEGYMPGWPGMQKFKGSVVHPQFWPQDLNYDGKRVVIIGSGATAVTLLPEMATRASHVTMLQRSPTYMISRSSFDGISAKLQRIMPARMAHYFTRGKNVFIAWYFYNLSRRKPDFVKRLLVGAVKKQLLAGYDVAKHFTPKYKPWDQRVCLVPNADLFKTLRSGKGSVVTDQIASFTETGLLLHSGEHLEADVIVTATGLKLKMLGGVKVDVDGKPMQPSDAMMYKGLMYSDVPNMGIAMGYTNASWTLKCELSAKYICRLINYMDAKGYAWCAPRRKDSDLSEAAALDLTSGYVQRAADLLPKQGSKKPWKLHQNYMLDTMSLKYGSVTDDAMEFGRVNPAQNNTRQKEIEIVTPRVKERA